MPSELHNGEVFSQPIPAAQVLSRQLQARGIRDLRVLEAIARTPRHRFLPPELRAEAYDDTALPIGRGQTISQPYIVALMTEALALSGEETVLEVGTGSGYQAAILSQLCRRVVTIERIAELSAAARGVLQEMGCSNIEFYVGDGTLGVPESAPYDGIIVTAAAPDVPQPLYDQLAPHGRLVIPVGDEQLQYLLLIRKTPAGPLREELCGCRFVKLIGHAAWSEEP